jgi:hypothetical protein
MGDPQLMSRITLLEGVPFERELAGLKENFKTTKFDQLFRTSKLVNPYHFKSTPGPIQRPLQQLSANIVTSAPLAPVSSNSTTDEFSTSATSTSTLAQSANSALTWASKTAAPFIPSASSPATAVNATTNSSPTINRNRHGQRIDSLDTTVLPEDLKRVKKLKLCNIYHLNGADACTNVRCTHDHSTKLSKYDLRTLRQVARMTPCHYKTECDDVKCIYGHRCPQSQPGEKECWYKEDCRFYGWGHGVDTRVCKTTRV